MLKKKSKNIRIDSKCPGVKNKLVNYSKNTKPWNYFVEKSQALQVYVAISWENFSIFIRRKIIILLVQLEA